MTGIITADWHLRSTVPQCSAETQTEWMNVQAQAILQIVNYAINNKCNLFIVGDLFHKVSDISFECVWMVQKAAMRLKEYGLRLYYIAGNHDLKYHSSLNLKDSAVGVLMHSDNCYMLDNNSMNDVGAANFDEVANDCKYVFRHVLVMPEKDKIPQVECYTAQTLVAEYKNARYIFIGDYHHSFIEGVDDQVVINPGCITIQAADMIDYRSSCIYFDDSEQPVIKKLYIDVERKFLDIKNEDKQVNSSLDVFVQAVKNNSEMTLDYISNLEKVLEKEPKEVCEIVKNWI